MTDKPVTQKDDFIADFHEGEMDMGKLQDKQFIVAVNTGDRNKCKLLASTIKGPFDFYEMAEQVGYMHAEELHHAKVVILDTDPKKPSDYLDSGTIDYIEAHWKNLISEGILETAIRDFTMEPGILSESELEEESNAT